MDGDGSVWMNVRLFHVANVHPSNLCLEAEEILFWF